MLLPIAGTIRNTVKLAELDNKWQQKKKNVGREKQEELDPQIKQFKEDMERIRQNRQMSSIDTKLQSGGELTPEELEYLKKNNPELYRQALEIAQEKQAYERQLKACRTKDEAEKLKVNRMGNFMAQCKTVMNNPNIPKAKKKELMDKLSKELSGILEVDKAFTQSAEYTKLPDKEETAGKKETAVGDETAGKDEAASGSETAGKEDMADGKETKPVDTAVQSSKDVTAERTPAGFGGKTDNSSTAADNVQISVSTEGEIHFE